MIRVLATIAVLAAVAAPAAAQDVGPQPQPSAAPAPTAAPPPPAPPPVDPAIVAATAAANAALAAADQAITAGQSPDPSLRQALERAPAGAPGDRIAMLATRRLGFSAMERRDLERAEAFFWAEALLAQRLFVRGDMGATRLAEAFNRLASAAGGRGDAETSAHLISLAADIRSRAQAVASGQALGRAAPEDEVDLGLRRVYVPSLCLVGREPALTGRVTCEDEAALRVEAALSDARRIKANAPPPETSEEKAARQARNKAKERAGRR
jgi:hypothetical protein